MPRFTHTSLVLWTLVVLALMLVATPAAQAQTFSVLHTFTDGPDGAWPYGGPTVDRAGNLYGTTTGGGNLGGNCPSGCGVVYKMSKKGSHWIFTPIYTFQGGNDGRTPDSRTVIGPDGSLYGAVLGLLPYGGLFNLRPGPNAPVSAIVPWLNTLLHAFTGGNNGSDPGLGDLTFDQSGNIYGTTESSESGGIVYELVKSNGGYTFNVLYQFTGGQDGNQPYFGVTFGGDGNLYGTTYFGGDLDCNPPKGCGVVFQLVPSGAGWSEKTLYSFVKGNDGGFPFGGVTFDQAGNLYGTTITGGVNGGGSVFELTPSNGSWIFNVVYSLTGPSGQTTGPTGNLVIDNAGNLYGATKLEGAYGAGNIFKLIPSNGGWQYTDLHDFSGDDGAEPYGNSLTVDASGNIFGTTVYGGSINGNCYSSGCGVVWEITP